MEALVTNASFVARGFAGDPKQLKNLLKAALSHDGLAVLDIISPCVTFHNKENSYHSYLWGKEHEVQLHDIEFVQARDEITIEDFEPGSSKEVSLHDGTVVLMKKLDEDYDPTNRHEALRILEQAERENMLVTGLLFVDPNAKTLFDRYNLPDEPLNRLKPEKLRPSEDVLAEINRSLFLK
jgi:2-oxoglutarate ferredoxin oxidoreductase subunit beta